MSYSADYTLAQTAAFQNQVQMSVMKAAIAIAGEAATSHATLDEKRHTLAVAVMGGLSGTLLTQFVMAAIEAGALVSGATDAQVDTAVASCWNAMAGVSNADTINVT
jgi:hypothetical protein